ncbi:MAG: hypothetical protein KAS13_08065, partial [Candidatus Omnitrophica bacterium]|nr:hypothetical protein [Candidatus Omnitrophota bacterium]
MMKNLLKKRLTSIFHHSFCKRQYNKVFGLTICLVLISFSYPEMDVFSQESALEYSDRDAEFTADLSPYPRDELIATIHEQEEEPPVFKKDVNLEEENKFLRNLLGNAQESFKYTENALENKTEQISELTNFFEGQKILIAEKQEEIDRLKNELEILHGQNKEFQESSIAAKKENSSL